MAAQYYNKKYDIRLKVIWTDDNEYVVRWTRNGKRDEGKCYYTDCRHDAQDTMNAMIKDIENGRGID